jgi:hypothetical protein
MFGSMHEIAARRGDGLRPELRELLRVPEKNVFDLAAFRPGGFRQSSPNPDRPLPEILPANVVVFGRMPTPTAEPDEQRRLVPRIGRAKRLTRQRD